MDNEINESTVNEITDTTPPDSGQAAEPPQQTEAPQDNPGEEQSDAGDQHAKTHHSKKEKKPGWLHERIKASPIKSGLLLTVVYVLLKTIFGGISDCIPEGTVHDVVSPLILLVWSVAMVIITGYGSSLRISAKKLGKSLLLDIPVLLAGAAVLIQAFNTFGQSGAKWQGPLAVVIWVLTIFCSSASVIGVSCGIISRSIGEKHGNDQEGVWYSALMSGLFFGLITLLTDDSGLGFASAAVYAVFGVVYAALYYRSGLLWIPVLLHGIIKAAESLGSRSILGASAPSFFVMIYLLPFIAAVICVLFILRKKRIGEAVENLCGKEAADRLPKLLTKAEKRQAKEERLERRKQTLKEQYADYPLWFRVFRIYLIRPFGVLAVAACCIALIVYGVFSFMMSDDFRRLVIDEMYLSGRNHVGDDVIQKESPKDDDGAAAINALAHGDQSDTWTICVYMVGSNLEDMNENDLSYATLVQTYDRADELKEKRLRKEIDQFSRFSDELKKNGIDIPAFLYDPIHPVASSTAVTNDVYTAATLGAASTDIYEMLEGEYSDNINIIIQTGGATRWGNPVINPNRTQRFRYKYDKNNEMGTMEELCNLPLQDSCSPDTLAEFLDYCDKNYRSDHNMLVLWDHGGGAFGYGCDDIYGSRMSNADVRCALDAVYDPDRNSPPFDIIGYDACLMSSIEVIHSLDGFARYLAVSEETEPGDGWDYTPWLSALSADPSMHPAQVAMAIADSYTDFYISQNVNLSTSLIGILGNVRYDVTFAVIDENKGCELYDAYCALTKRQLADAVSDISVLSEIGRCGQKSTKMCGSASAYYSTVDLGNYVDYMIDTYPEECSRIKDLLNETVMYHRENGAMSDSQGVSVYLPSSIDSYDGMSMLLSYLYDICDDDSTRALYYYKMAGCLNDEMKDYVSTISTAEPKVINTEVFRSFKNADPLCDEYGFKIPVSEETKSMIVDYYTDTAIFNSTDYQLIELGYDENAYLDGEGYLCCDFDGTWVCIDGVPLATEVISSSPSYVEYCSSVYYNERPSYLLFSMDRDTEEYTINGIVEQPDEENANYLTNSKSIKEVALGSTIKPIYRTTGILDGKISNTPGRSISFGMNSTIGRRELENGYCITLAVIKDQRGDSYYSKAVRNTVSGGKVTEREVDPSFIGTND